MKRWIMILALLGSLLWADKPDPKAIVGKIGEETYTYAEYDKILKGYYDYYQKQLGKPLTDEDKAQYNDRCWDELIGRHIYDKAIKAGKIRITTQELLAEAKKNPPAAVRTIKDLQLNGRFNQKEYEKALGTPGQFRDAVLDEVRSMYQYSKLLETVRNEVDADPDSVRREWERKQELVDAQIIFFDAMKMTSINASDDDARLYYQGHLDQYKRENCRRYHYVRFAKAATAEDSLAIRAQVDDLLRQLRGGADFAQMARDKSQDTGSGKNGGDLGWFGRGRMVAPFEEAAFKLELGQISEPVLSQFGWHIIQLMERRTTEAGEEEISARHILLRNDPSERTLQNMKGISAQLHAIATRIGLPAAADSLGLKLEETTIFQEKDSFIRNIGREAKLVSYAFANPVGSLAEPYFAPSGDIFVCAVSAELPVYYIPFEDEKNNVIQSATRSKRGYYMNQYVQNFVKTLTADQYLATAARDSVMIVEVKDHKKGDTIAGIGKQDALEEALFATPVGSFSPLVSEQMRWFLARVDRHSMPDVNIWLKEKPALLKAARDEVRQKHLNDWYRGEYQKVSITDNRKDFYDLPKGKMQMLSPGGGKN